MQVKGERLKVKGNLAPFTFNLSPLTSHLTPHTSHLIRGFTLVEMLVVTVLVGILGTGMASSFLSGMRLWGRAQQRDAAHTDALWTLEVMATELRQSVNVPLVAFEGSAHEIIFPAVVNDGLVKVVYRYEASERRLQREQTDMKDLLEEPLEAPRQDRTLCSRLDEVLIEFGAPPKEMDDTGYEWVDEWEEGDGVPQAVRVTLTMKDATLTKTIFIPIA